MLEFMYVDEDETLDIDDQEDVWPYDEDFDIEDYGDDDDFDYSNDDEGTWYTDNEIADEELYALLIETQIADLSDCDIAYTCGNF